MGFLLYLLSGAIAGLFSGMFRVGGGTLSVLYLIYCNHNARNAIGTSAALGLPIALAGTIGYIFTGLNIPGLPAMSLGFVYLPAFACVALVSVLSASWGAMLVQRLPIPTLKRLFALLLYVVGIKMVWGCCEEYFE